VGSLSTACLCDATVCQPPRCGDALVCMPKCRGMQAPVMMRQACADGPCSKVAQPPRLADYTTATMKPGRTRSTSTDLKQSSFLDTTRVASASCNVRKRYVPATTYCVNTSPALCDLSRGPGRHCELWSISRSPPFIGPTLSRHQWVSWSGIQGKTG